jgi:hypothetical protein
MVDEKRGAENGLVFFFAFLPEAAGRRTNSAEGATVPL